MNAHHVPVQQRQASDCHELDRYMIGLDARSDESAVEVPRAKGIRVDHFQSCLP